MKPLTRYGIILASGIGTRYESDIPKQFTKIAGKTILEYTLEVFEKSPCIDAIILVITPQYRQRTKEILLRNKYQKIVKLINGGRTRKESSYLGLCAIEEPEAHVIIHDCARPFVSQRILEDCVKALQKYDAVDVAIPSADTIIQVQGTIIKDIPPRDLFRQGQTPQAFRLTLIKKAHELSRHDSNFTDDCGLIVKHRLAPVYVVEGERENMKITYPSDIFLADRIFQLKSAHPPHGNKKMQLKGKTLVVFGGASGIGQEIARLATQTGATVFTPSRRSGADVTSYRAVVHFLRKVFAKTGQIDAIMNCAALLKIGKLETRDIADIKQEIGTNYLGAIHIAKAAIPYLRQTKGHLLFFTSSSYTRGRALYATYSSCKAAIVNLTQALAEELSTDNICVNAINPERTQTPMRLKAFGKEPAASLLPPRQVAQMALRVLRSNITGQVIDVRKKSTRAI